MPANLGTRHLDQVGRSATISASCSGRTSRDWASARSKGFGAPLDLLQRLSTDDAERAEALAGDLVYRPFGPVALALGADLADQPFLREPLPPVEPPRQRQVLPPGGKLIGATELAHVPDVPADLPRLPPGTRRSLPG